MLQGTVDYSSIANALKLGSTLLLLYYVCDKGVVSCQLIDTINASPLVPAVATFEV